MYPTILELGSLAIRSYGVALAAAVLLTVWLVERDARKRGVKSHAIFDLAVTILLASIVGARVMYVLQHWGEYQHDPLRSLMVWEGGLIFLGGLVPGVLAGLLYLRRKKLWFLRDTIALYLPIGVGITRIGCFLNGCCFGKPTDFPLGIVFPSPCLAGAHPVHPTQLYSAVAAFSIFAILKTLRKRSPAEGSIFWAFFALYALFRLGVDVLRYYEPPAYLGWLTVNQWVSVVLLIVSLTALLRLRFLNE
jgi:phosphatidylglycerol:prolipoprotein diacylglycerol transferase